MAAVRYLIDELHADLVNEPAPEGGDDPFGREEPDTPLNLAIASDSAEIVAFLIEKGVKPSALNLCRAVYKNPNDLKVIETLIDAVGDSDEYHGNATALMAAAENGRLEAAKLLLSRGADPRKLARDGQTVLQFAGSGGNPEVISLIAKLMATPAPE